MRAFFDWSIGFLANAGDCYYRLMKVTPYRLIGLTGGEGNYESRELHEWDDSDRSVFGRFSLFVVKWSEPVSGGVAAWLV